MEAFALRDLPGVYRVCADVDARGGSERQWLHAPDLAGHVFAGPYLLSDPQLGWVVADDLGVAGYLVATADTAAFEAWRELDWYPPLRTRHPLGAPRSDGSADDRYLRFLHMPPRGPEALPQRYPAELHIKLDPRVAGRGWGRRLIEALVLALRDRGCLGVHLGVAAENSNAIDFYTHVGFRALAHGSGSLVMVRDIK